MKGGNPNRFLEYIFNGVDIVYVYNGKKFWGQGWTISTGFHYEIYQCEPLVEGFHWIYNGENQRDCQQAFIKAPIFDGKTFWEAEQDIEWVDY